jgi:hypothetical protein
MRRARRAENEALSHTSIVSAWLLAEFEFGSGLWVKGTIYYVKMNQFCFFNDLAIYFNTSEIRLMCTRRLDISRCQE